MTDDDSKIREIVKDMMEKKYGGFTTNDRVKTFSLGIQQYAEDCLRVLENSVASESEWFKQLDSVKGWSEKLKNDHAHAFQLVHEGAQSEYEYAVKSYATSIATPCNAVASLSEFILHYMIALTSVREIRERSYFSSLPYSDRSALGDNTLRRAVAKCIKAIAPTPAAAPPAAPEPKIMPNDSVSQIAASREKSKSRKRRWEGASVFSDASSYASGMSRASRSEAASRASRASPRRSRRSRGSNVEEEKSPFTQRSSAAKSVVAPSSTDFKFADGGVDDVYTSLV